MKLFNAISSLLWFFPLFGLMADDAGGGGAPAGGTDGAGGPPAGGGQGSPTGAGAGGDSPAASASTGSVDLKFLDQPLGKGWAKQAGFPEAWETKFSTARPLIGSLAAAEKLIGAKGIIKPGANATPQEIDAYHASLGRPAKPEDYGLSTKPDKIRIGDKDVDVPGEIYDAAVVKDFTAMAHKIGLTAEQAKTIRDFDLARGINAKGKFDEMMTTGKTDTEAALAKAWGKENVQANVQVAVEAALKAGMTKEEMQAHPELANSPIFLKVLNHYGKMLGESPTSGARGASDGRFVNAATEIKAIQNDKNHAYHSRTNDQAHKEAVAHMKHLFELKQSQGG